MLIRAESRKEAMAWHVEAWHGMTGRILRNPKNPRSSKDHQNVPMTPVRAGRGVARHGTAWHDEDGNLRNPRSSKDRQNVPMTPVRAGSQKKPRYGVAWRGMVRRSTAQRKTAWRTRHAAQRLGSAAQGVAQTIDVSQSRGMSPAIKAACKCANDLSCPGRTAEKGQESRAMVDVAARKTSTFKERRKRVIRNMQTHGKPFKEPSKTAAAEEEDSGTCR